MNYNGREFTDFTIISELQQGIVGYMETSTIREYVLEATHCIIDEVRKECNVNFTWYVEVEDRSTVCIEIKECDNVDIIEYLLKEVNEKFNQSNIIIYFELKLHDEEIPDCFSDMDEGFDFGLLG